MKTINSFEELEAALLEVKHAARLLDAERAAMSLGFVQTAADLAHVEADRDLGALRMALAKGEVMA